MDKLDQYLDQVCRRIGGPRSLRQHVRQELREHLRDAAAEHQAAGLSEVEALDRALEEFGKSEEVRSELEATHGRQPMLAVVIDKAMQWKEMTMKAKWLWTSWAYLALVAVIVLGMMFISFNVIFIIPKFQKLTADGIIDPAIVDEQGASWMPSFLNTLNAVAGRVTTLLVLLAAALWGLFEWRVRSENKPFMRLSALGTVAVGLMVIVVLTAGSLVISFCLGVPAIGRLARPYAVDRVAHIDTSVRALEQALVKMDWKGMEDQALDATQTLEILAKTAPAMPALTTWNEPPTAVELRAHVKAASEGLLEARRAILKKNGGQLETALANFHRSFGPVLEAAKKPRR